MRVGLVIPLDADLAIAARTPGAPAQPADGR
jgi:hypothetical protein